MTTTTLSQRLDSFVGKATPFVLVPLFAMLPFFERGASLLYAAAIALLVLHLIARRQILPTAKVYYLIGVIYLVVVVLSLAITPDLREGLKILRQQSILLLGWFIIERVKEEQLARRLLIAFAIGGAVLGLIGLYQGLYLHVNRPPNIWHWVCGGNLLLFAATTTLVLLIYFNGLWQRILLLVLFVVQVSALYVNGTRGAWIALAVVVCLLPFLVRIRWQWRLLYMLAVLIGFLFIARGDYFHIKYNEAMSDITRYLNKDVETSIGSRFEMWRASIEMFRRSPLLGVGTGAWQEAVAVEVNSGNVHKCILQYHQAHSLYLDALANRGVLGLLALMLLVTYPLFAAIVKGQNSHFSRTLVVSIGIALLIAGLSDTLNRIRPNYMAYIALTAVGLSIVLRSSKTHLQESE